MPCGSSRRRTRGWPVSSSCGPSAASSTTRSPRCWASPTPRCGGTGAWPRAGFTAGSAARPRERSMADPERFLRLRSVFEKVIEKTPSGRRQALSELRQDEPELAAEAAALVVAEAGASSFLAGFSQAVARSEEHTSELQSRSDLV